MSKSGFRPEALEHFWSGRPANQWRPETRGLDSRFDLHRIIEQLTWGQCCREYWQKSCLGDPIDCIVEEIPQNVMDTYCWIHSTYSISDKVRIIPILIDKPQCFSKTARLYCNCNKIYHSQLKNKKCYSCMLYSLRWTFYLGELHPITSTSVIHEYFTQSARKLRN
jgi:hypothetical protein